MKYDFICEDGHIFEIEKPMEAPNPEKCPKCGKPVRRVWNIAAIHGFGPYKSDRAMRQIEKDSTDGLDPYDQKYGITEED